MPLFPFHQMETQRHVPGGQGTRDLGSEPSSPSTRGTEAGRSLEGDCNPTPSAFHPTQSLSISRTLHPQEVEHTQALGHPTLEASPFLPRPST